MKRLDRELLKKNIDAVAHYDLENRKVFGSSYFVYQEGMLPLEVCYGEVTPDSIFRLASMTKPITAVATLILVDQGLLCLDDPIEKYLPEFGGVHIIDEKGKDWGYPKTKPTLRHILSHCSGIGSYPEKTADITEADRKDAEAYIRYHLKIGLDFEPASMQRYSGMAAFDVLMKIIELVSGKDFLEFLDEEIFKPCGMVDTTFIPSPQQWARMVPMHCRENGENAVFTMPQGCVFEDFPTAHYLGGAGLISTLGDYVRFCTMLLHEGQSGERQLIQKETFAQMRTPQILKKDNESWGLGVRVIDSKAKSGLPAGVFGWSGAYGSHFWIDLERKIFAVYMKNSKVDGGAGNESAVKFEEAVYSSFEEA